jgi:hypothetical protein
MFRMRVFYFHDVCSWFPRFRAGDCECRSTRCRQPGALRADVPPRTRWPRATFPFPTRRIVLGVASLTPSDLVIHRAGSRATTGFAGGLLLWRGGRGVAFGDRCKPDRRHDNRRWPQRHRIRQNSDPANDISFRLCSKLNNVDAAFLPRPARII